MSNIEEVRKFATIKQHDNPGFQSSVHKKYGGTKTENGVLFSHDSHSSSHIKDAKKKAEEIHGGKLNWKKSAKQGSLGGEHHMAVHSDGTGNKRHITTVQYHKGTKNISPFTHIERTSQHSALRPGEDANDYYKRASSDRKNQKSEQFIDDILDKNFGEASEAFNEMMTVEASEQLEAKKAEVAQALFFDESSALQNVTRGQIHQKYGFVNKLAPKNGIMDFANRINRRNSNFKLFQIFKSATKGGSPSKVDRKISKGKKGLAKATTISTRQGD